MVGVIIFRTGASFSVSNLTLFSVRRIERGLARLFMATFFLHIFFPLRFLVLPMGWEESGWWVFGEMGCGELYLQSRTGWGDPLPTTHWCQKKFLLHRGCLHTEGVYKVESFVPSILLIPNILPLLFLIPLSRCPRHGGLLL